MKSAFEDCPGSLCVKVEEPSWVPGVSVVFYISGVN